MYPELCAECGGRVEISTDAMVVEVRGDAVVTPGIEHGRCTVCGEEYLTLDGVERLQRAAIRRSKQVRGLLSPEEIKDVRLSLDLTQAEFERLLGVGPKTVVRWEKGTVYQSATADRLMRLIRTLPEVRCVLETVASGLQPVAPGTQGAATLP